MPLLVAAAIAEGYGLAQSKTTRALTGHVVDDAGGALAGVRVELASPALIGGVRSGATDRSGLFRFPELPPGVYTVRTSLERFRAVAVQGVVLTLGSTTDVPVTMPLAAQAEAVVVADVSPPIDRASSETSTNLSEDYLQKLPTDRLQPFVLNLAPGINLSSAFGGAAYSANAYLIDGVDTSDAGTGGISSPFRSTASAPPSFPILCETVTTMSPSTAAAAWAAGRYRPGTWFSETFRFLAVA